MKKLALALVLAATVLGACGSKKNSSTLPSNNPASVGGQAPDGANPDDPSAGNPPGAPNADPAAGTNTMPSGSESDPCAGGE